MRYYETLYILNPNFEQEKIDGIVKEVDEQINKISQVINHRLWGKKRLAYTIEQHKYGSYMLLQFETKNVKGLVAFDNFMKLNKSILRFQTVRLDSKPDTFVEEVISDLEENDIEAPIVVEPVGHTQPVAVEKAADVSESSDNESDNQELEESGNKEVVAEDQSKE